MSFKTICDGCGSLTGPSIGICPYCKRCLAEAGNEEPSVASLQRLYHEGRLDRACAVAQRMEGERQRENPQLPFLLLYAKIVVEADGPDSLLSSLMARARSLAPEDPAVLDYGELARARSCLGARAFESAEVLLKRLLRRSPDNVHAHFLLGGHLLLTRQEIDGSLRHLEQCVHLHPNFLRAWGCLAVIYQQKGDSQRAERAYLRCLGLESDPHMIEFFRAELKSLGAPAAGAA